MGKFCTLHPLVGEVYRRVSELLGVPPRNFESLEFLEYGPGQHYVAHDDAGPIDHAGAGHRVLTAFMYLSDVQRGGETDFPTAGLRITPEKGKLIVWSNVRNGMLEINPFAKHASLPVKAGQKFAMNLWIHAGDMRNPEHFGQHCA